jgi:hypothetical protein
MLSVPIVAVEAAEQEENVLRIRTYGGARSPSDFQYAAPGPGNGVCSQQEPSRSSLHHIESSAAALEDQSPGYGHARQRLKLSRRGMVPNIATDRV